MEGRLDPVSFKFRFVMKSIVVALLTLVCLVARLTGNDLQPVVALGMPNIEAEGWITLFNGKDLTGWTQRNGTATYRVENNAIVGKTAEGSPNSFLCSNSSYGDFELTFEVNDAPGLNSGVQIRSLSKSEFKNGRVHRPQIEIETSPGESGYI